MLPAFDLDSSISSISSLSSNSQKSLDKLELGIRKNKTKSTKYKKFFGQRTSLVSMTSLERGLQQSILKAMQPHSEENLHQVDIRQNQFKRSINLKLRSECFDLNQYYDHIVPQLIDWASKKCMVLGTKYGLNIMNFKDNPRKIQFNNQWNTKCLQFKNQQILGVGSGYGHILIYDIITQKKVRSIPQKQKSKFMNSLIWDHNLIIKGSEQYIKGKDVSTNKEVQFQFNQHKRGQCITSFSIRDKLLAVGYEEGELALYDLRNQKLLSQIIIQQQGYGNFVQFSPWSDALLCARGNSIYEINPFSVQLTKETQVQNGVTGFRCLSLSSQMVISSQRQGIVLRNKQYQTNGNLQKPGQQIFSNGLGASHKHNIVSAITMNKNGYAWFLPYNYIKRQNSLSAQRQNYTLR